MAEKKAINASNQEMREKDVGGLEVDESTLMGEDNSFQSACVCFGERWTNLTSAFARENRLRANALNNALNSLLIGGRLIKNDSLNAARRKLPPWICKFCPVARSSGTHSRLKAMAKQRFG